MGVEGACSRGEALCGQFLAKVKFYTQVYNYIRLDKKRMVIEAFADNRESITNEAQRV